MSGDLARMAAAALIVGCGCPDDKVDAVWRKLVPQPIPPTMSGLVAQVRLAVAAVVDIPPG